MKLLVKVGGTLLDDSARRLELSAQLARLSQNHNVVVVHGGGKQMTRFLEERGIASRFVNGLRVSDEAVIDALLKVVAGSANKQFVASLSAAGAPALGLSGVDGRLTTAYQMNKELGFVGQPIQSNGKLLRLLSENGYLPVVACVAADERGVIYNVNADQMAVSCAAAFGADQLIFLTDVAGVKNGSGSVLPNITAAFIDELIQSGVAHGGMQAKLTAALAAAEGGVAEVVIASGQEDHVCERILSGQSVGTRLTLASLPSGYEAAR